MKHTHAMFVKWFYAFINQFMLSSSLYDILMVLLNLFSLYCSSAAASIYDIDDAVPTTTAASFSINNLQPLSRRTRSHKGDNQLGAYGLVDGPYIPSSMDGG